MFLKVATIAGVALCLALPAVAQTSTQQTSTQPTSTQAPPSQAASPDTQSMMGQPVQGMSGSSIRQHISMDLKKAGFSDVKIMPASFVATAKNKKGDDVTMLITPDSVTTITDVPASGQSASNGKMTTGGTATASNSK
jgi:hypothetical protein